VDDAVTRVIQRPLKTVGGLTTNLEEEILRSEISSRQMKEESKDRMLRQQLLIAEASVDSLTAYDVGMMSDSDNGDMSHRSASRSLSHPHSSHLRRSLAVTKRNKFLVWLAVVYSWLLSIEVLSTCPLFLFLCGWDELATLCLLTTLVASIISQVFKRFVWRARPWMTGRAIVVRRDKTSSFPSRAVVCAVVVAYVFSHLFYPPHHVPFGVLFAAVCVLSLFAALSRILVSAHYFSDCLFGLFIGIICCSIGSGFNKLAESECGSCHNDLCYALNEEQYVDLATLSHLNIPTLSIVAAISIVAVGLMMMSPVMFWFKCIPIFGLQFPTLAFRLFFLCPDHNSMGMALSKPDSPPAHVIAASAAISVAALLVTKLIARYSVVEPPTQLNTDADNDNDTDGRNDVGVNGNSSSSSSSSTGCHETDGMDSHAPGNSEAARLFLRCSPVRTMVWNLATYTIIFATAFVALAAWRLEYTNMHPKRTQ